MLVALAISHLWMAAALTLQDYHHLCLWLVSNINKNNNNPINLSLSLVETRVPGEKPLQATYHIFTKILMIHYRQ
jgi:hypothetical protein